MRTRKQIEDGMVLPDIHRELLLDIRQTLALMLQFMPAQPSTLKPEELASIKQLAEIAWEKT